MSSSCSRYRRSWFWILRQSIPSWVHSYFFLFNSFTFLAGIWDSSLTTCTTHHFLFKFRRIFSLNPSIHSASRRFVWCCRLSTFFSMSLRHLLQLPPPPLPSSPQLLSLDSKFPNLPVLLASNPIISFFCLVTVCVFSQLAAQETRFRLKNAFRHHLPSQLFRIRLFLV